MSQRLPWRLGLLLGACFVFARGTPAQEVFNECQECPRMVRISGGTFTMGSPADEPERRRYEGPRSNVHVANFAISQTEVTRDQYAAFARATNRAADGGCYTHGDGTSDISVKVESASWRAPGFLESPSIFWGWAKIGTRL